MTLEELLKILKNSFCGKLTYELLNKDCREFRYCYECKNAVLSKIADIIEAALEKGDTQHPQT